MMGFFSAAQNQLSLLHFFLQQVSYSHCVFAGIFGQKKKRFVVDIQVKEIRAFHEVGKLVVVPGSETTLSFNQNIFAPQRHVNGFTKGLAASVNHAWQPEPKGEHQ